MNAGASRRKRERRGARPGIPRWQSSTSLPKMSRWRREEARSLEPSSGNLDLDGRIAEVIKRLNQSTFGNPADKAIVLKLYPEYAERIAKVFEQTLGGMASGEHSLGLPPMPTASSELPQLRFAGGQLLLLRSVNGAVQLCKVEEAGSATLLIGSGEATVSIDDCDQTTLPWRPQAAERQLDAIASDAALLKKSRRPVLSPAAPHAKRQFLNWRRR